LESACFQASSIRKTSAALKLRTDASMRFEKSQDPENTTRALARAMELLPVLSPGIRVVGGVSDQRKPRVEPPPIHLPLDWLARKLGRELTAEQVRNILESLAFQVEQRSENLLEVRVPSWRATKDISIKDDLVEEVGRMIGYDSISPAAPLVVAGAIPRDPQRLFFRGVRARLTALGFTEVYNYSFISEEQAAAFGMKPQEHVEVANPIASDQTLMRTSLLPGIRKNFIENSRHLDEFRFFEIGREIHKRTDGLPDEIPHLAVAMFSKSDGGLFELKHAAEALLPGVQVVPAESLAWEHPARAARVVWQLRDVGRLFEFHPAIIEQGRASVLELDLRAVQEIGMPETRYKALRRFPSSAFDLSVLAPLRDLAGDLERRLSGFIPSSLFESIEFVRQYSGPPLPEGRKSVSFRITVGSPEKTLSADEVGAIRSAVIEGMRAQGYELRI
jgi:phenylalanyl-tRNA synthetase beta chain